MSKNKVKKQDLGNGIFLEKFVELIDKQKYYVMNLTIHQFKEMLFTVDLTGSQNIQIVDQNGLIKEMSIQPFTKVEVVRLKLKKKWKLKTKFKYVLSMPELSLQRQYYQEYIQNLNLLITKTSMLKEIDCKNLPEDKLEQYLDRNQIKFFDQQFPPSNESLGFVEKEQIDRFGGLVQWKQSSQLNKLYHEDSEKEEFLQFIQPQNIQQGKLNNNWFVSALACLATNPKFIKRLFLKRSNNNYEYYKVKVCKMGFWKIQILDDYFPCYILGEPLFSHNIENDYWVLLLEKAYAKIFGNYSCLENGNCKHALIDLTSCPTFTYKIDDESTQKLILQGKFLKVIQKALADRYIIAASSKAFLTEEEQKNKDNAQSYNIIDIVEYKDQQLINISNPQGLIEWNGEWGPNSDNWTESAIDELMPDLESNENLFMTWQDFLNHFDMINICKIKAWQELKLKGKFVKSIDKFNDEITHFCSRYYYKLNVSQKTVFIIGVHQEDERIVGVKELRPYLDIGIALFQKNGNDFELINFIDSDYQRERFLEFKLDKGEYYFLPLSTGNSMKFDDYEVPIDKYRLRSPLVKSFAQDLFEKFDYYENDFLSFEEFQKLYQTIDKNITETEFDQLAQNFNFNTIKITQKKGLSEKGFYNWLDDLFLNKPKDQIIEFLNQLGYSKNLVSKRSRIFCFSLHSDNAVKVEVEDALKDNIDFILYCIIAEKYGEKMKKQALNDDVFPIRYQNQKTKTISYS